jgi:hypothetical protein
MASWEDWGNFLVHNHIFLWSRIKDTHFWRQTYSLRKEIWRGTPTMKDVSIYDTLLGKVQVLMQVSSFG